MGSQNYLWHFLLSVLLCTLMALEGRDTMASTDTSARTSSGEGESSTMIQEITTTEPTTSTSYFLPSTSLVSLVSVTNAVLAGSTDTTPTEIMSGEAPLEPSPRSGAVSPALPTTGTGTTTAPESGTASSQFFSSAVMSDSSSSSSSPEGFSAVTASPQQSGTSGTTGAPLATTSQPSPALVSSSPSSTSGAVDNELEPTTNSPAPITASTNPVLSTSGTSSTGSSAVPPSPQQSSTSSTTGAPLATTSQPSPALVSSTAGDTDTASDAVTAEEVTPSPAPSTASTNTVSSASETAAPSRSSSAGSSTGTPAPGHSSPALPQEQPTALGTNTSPPTGSPSPSTATAPAGSSATTPPGEGDSSTTKDRTTAQPNTETSHSLLSTSLATPSTTDLHISTSANPGTCLTVSINIQKVTAEEIQLNWTSSSKGSFYNISAKDNGKEIQAITTNETKAVFKNLLPGHQYTISVAVSSCAENNSASVTVRTDYDSCLERTELCLAQSTGCSDLKGIVCSNQQAFSCRVWLTNRTFNNTLYDSESEDYKAMSASFKKEVVAAMDAELGNNHSDIFVLGFRSGSVIVDFLFLLPKEEATDVGAIQAHLSNVLKSKFGSQSEVQTLSVQSSTDNSSSWRVAVIVLGVLLGIALVLILLAIVFYIHVRRSGGERVTNAVNNRADLGMITQKDDLFEINQRREKIY